MKSFIAALRTLVLPFGATTGTRIVLDGVNGQIEVYDASNDLVGLIDSSGLWAIDNDGSYVLVTNNGAFGAEVQLQPNDVVGLTYAHGNLYATTFPGQDNVPVTVVGSPRITSPFSGDFARIYVLGEDDALNPPMIDLRSTGPVRVLDGDFQAFNDIRCDGFINGGYVHVDRLHLTSSGNFDKSAYPLAKRITVSVQAGGGGGGGAGATGAGQWSYGDGGGGGEYAQATYDLSLLNTLTAYVVGPGGGGGTGANPGGTGGISNFQAAVGPITTIGGGGGSIRPATNVVGIWSQNTNLRVGGTGGTGGHFRSPGGCGGSGQGFGSGASGIRGGDGGCSFLGHGVPGQVNTNGATGTDYGSGGSGASRAASSSAQDGGDGAPGIVMIDIYA